MKRLERESIKLEDARTINVEPEQPSFQGNLSHLRRFLAALKNNTPEIWNQWRKSHPGITPNLRGINLQGAMLKEFDLRGARLEGADFTSAVWWSARLSQAHLQHARFDFAELLYADLAGANLDFARLVGANLTHMDATKACFRKANLRHAILNSALLHGADLTEANVTGTSAWAIEIDKETKQKDLLVQILGDILEELVDDSDSAKDFRTVRIQNVEAAHLLHLVTTNKTKTIIDALTDRVVLILGNFGLRQLAFLERLRQRLLELGYAAVIFDFAVNRDLIDGVTVLAGLSKFVIADLTKARSTPLESLLIASQFMIPFAPIIRKEEQPFSMFSSLQAKYHWVLPTWKYRDRAHLIRNVERIVKICEQKQRELERKRRSTHF